MSKSTLYWGLFNGFGLGIMKFRLTNRKMILFHNILNANDWQLCKKVAEEQERFDIENG